MAHTLLLADDSVTIQRVIELTFADEDIDVVAVGDGDQAIARLNTAPRPDIVLADIGMPGKTGYEVADYVKHSPELSHIPVVLLTGAFEPVDQARADAVECDGVLAKPFEPQLVVGRVKELLARPRPVESAKDRVLQPLTAATFDTATRPSPDTTLPRAPVAELDEYFDRLDAAFANLSGGGRAVVHGETSEHVREAETLLHQAEQEPGRAVAPVPNAESLPGSAPSVPPATGVQIPTTDRGLSYASPPVDFAAPSSATAGPSEVAPPSGPEAPTETVTAHHGGPAASVTGLDVASVHTPAGGPSSSPSTATMPSLVEAFTALLAAERTAATPDSAPAWPAGAVAPTVRPTLSDDEVERIVERVTRQVLDRLSDRVVRETVAETVSSIAERLIREEIDRIRQAIK